MIKFACFFLLALCLVSTNAAAQQGGKTVFNTLSIAGSARAAAMGGHYLASKDGDINLALQNPALLDSNMHHKLALSYVDYFSKTNFGYASFAHTLDTNFTVAATVQYLNFGKFNTTDEAGAQTGEFSAAEYIFTAGAGYRVDSLYSLGANVKFIYSNIANQYASGMALDLAATYYKPSKKFTAALVLKNMGKQLMAYGGGDKQKLPFNIQVAVSKQLTHAPFRFYVLAQNLQQWDLTYVNPNEVLTTDPVTGEVTADKKFAFGDKLMRHVVGGIEFIISPNINLQLAYNYRTRQEMKLADRPGMAGFSYGFGVRVKRFGFNYGRSVFHLAGPSNHFSVTTELASFF